MDCEGNKDGSWCERYAEIWLLLPQMRRKTTDGTDGTDGYANDKHNDNYADGLDIARANVNHSIGLSISLISRGVLLSLVAKMPKSPCVCHR